MNQDTELGNRQVNSTTTKYLQCEILKLLKSMQQNVAQIKLNGSGNDKNNKTKWKDKNKDIAGDMDYAPTKVKSAHPKKVGHQDDATLLQHIICDSNISNIYWCVHVY